METRSTENKGQARSWTAETNSASLTECGRYSIGWTRKLIERPLNWEFAMGVVALMGACPPSVDVGV